jgi:hypothetical protein
MPVTTSEHQRLPLHQKNAAADSLYGRNQPDIRMVRINWPQ